MANINVTIRLDEELKSQLQDLLSKLGLDMTTFFVMAAKQAVREQALPFTPSLNRSRYEFNECDPAVKTAFYNKGINQNISDLLTPSAINQLLASYSGDTERK